MGKFRFRTRLEQSVNEAVASDPMLEIVERTPPQIIPQPTPDGNNPPQVSDDDKNKKPTPIQLNPNIRCNNIEYQNDVTNPRRVEECSSFSPCQNGDTFDDSMCNASESCAAWTKDNQKIGCILTKYCGVTALYKGTESQYRCPGLTEAVVPGTPLPDPNGGDDDEMSEAERLVYEEL